MNRTRHGVTLAALAVFGAALFGLAAVNGPRPADDTAKSKYKKALIERFTRIRVPNMPFDACFAEGTDPEIIAEFEAFMQASGYWPPPGTDIFPDDPPPGEDGGAAYQLGTRWSGAQGSPRALTWSFAPDGLVCDGEVNDIFASLDAKFAAQGGRATWINRFVQSFARFSALSGLTYTRITTGGTDWDDGASWGTGGSAGLRGDVRICAIEIDNASNVLAYNYFPSNGDMHLDHDENWGSTGNQNRLLRNTIMHEHGHGVGIAHVCPANGLKLMEPALNTSWDGLRHDDLRAVQRHYGDPNEADDSSGTANVLGSLTSGVPLVVGTAPNPTTGSNDTDGGGGPLMTTTSIDANGENDYFQFTVASSGTIDITLDPIGESYDSSVQNANGSCSSGNIVDSSTRADLAVQLIDTNGTTVLATADTAALGVNEVINDANLAAAGNYYIRVYETSTQTSSQLYLLTLTYTLGACTAPSISSHPASISRCVGTAASFSVTATGTAPLSYQWRKNTVNIGGATSSTYNIASVVVGDAGSYDCVVTNPCGNVTSNAATLTVNTAPSITTHPTSLIRCAGASASFIVTAGGTGPLTYQWRKNTVNIGGATTDTLSFPSVVVGDAGSYDCVVTNSCGSITSNAATLTVNTAPSISSHPAGITRCVGTAASFSVTASGTAPLSYQWRKNTVNIGGATSSTYNIASVVVGDAGNYDCVVTNSCGSATSNAATLTVTTAPSITGHPANQTVDVGDPASFTVTATGSAPLSYQWRKNTVNIGGATSSTYNIASAALADAGTYDCVVTNSCGSATSNGALLTVNDVACNPCDANCNGTVNPFDIQDFLDILNGAVSPCSPCAADTDANGTVNPFDINAFLACL